MVCVVVGLCLVGFLCSILVLFGCLVVCIVFSWLGAFWILFRCVFVVVLGVW